MAWTARYNGNPTDPHPITWTWDGTLSCNEDGMMGVLHRFADAQGQVSPTPTGPFAPPDLTIPHVAFTLVWRLGIHAGLGPDEIEVEGDGWWWPNAPLVEPVAEGVIY